MKCLTFIVFIFAVSSLASAGVLSFENEDGSYGTANSILALLTKSGGWVTNESDMDNEEPSSVDEYGSSPKTSNPSGNIDGSYGSLTINPGNFLAPHLEILSIVENLLKLKGEISSRLYALIYDNIDLIRGVSNVLIAKIGHLHSFSLTGISILRKVIEFAVQLIGQWSITVPSISFDASHQSSGSNSQFSITKLLTKYYNV